MKPKRGRGPPARPTHPPSDPYPTTAAVAGVGALYTLPLPLARRMGACEPQQGVPAPAPHLTCSPQRRARWLRTAAAARARVQPQPPSVPCAAPMTSACPWPAAAAVHGPPPLPMRQRAWPSPMPAAPAGRGCAKGRINLESSLELQNNQLNRCRTPRTPLVPTPLAYLGHGVDLLKVQLVAPQVLLDGRDLPLQLLRVAPVLHLQRALHAHQRLPLSGVLLRRQLILQGEGVSGVGVGVGAGTIPAAAAQHGSWGGVHGVGQGAGSAGVRRCASRHMLLTGMHTGCVRRHYCQQPGGQPRPSPALAWSLPPAAHASRPR